MSTKTTGVVGWGYGWQKLVLSWDVMNSMPTIPTPWRLSKLKVNVKLFHRLGPLGRVGHRVAMPVFLCVCLSQKL